MDSPQNFNNCSTQNFNPLFFMNINSYVNQNNNNFNQINPMNQMNNNINNNMNNFNPMNQMNNNINYYMNYYSQLNQMNDNLNFNMNNNNSMFYNANNNYDIIIDLFPYIKEEKKIIKFINSDYKSNSIKIPISINKSELYSIAYNYKSHPSLKFILSYKNVMIREDESSIEEIPEGAEINIIEERPIPNTCYYDKLIKKYGNDDIRIVKFLDPFGNNKLLNFPGEATLSDVKISYYNKYGLNENMASLLYNSIKMNDNDKRRIKDITNSGITISVMNLMYYAQKNNFGKRLVGNVIAKIETKEKEDIKYFQIEIGTLESTSKLFDRIEIMLCLNKKIKRLYLNNKEINREDKQSIKSLGIKENFNVIVEL